MNSFLFVMSNPNPGCETEYSNWYCEQHLADVVRVPGVVDGRFYELTPRNKEARWQHTVRFELYQPVDQVVAELRKRSGSPDMPSTNTIHSPSTLMLSATPRGPRVSVAAVDGPVALYMTLTKAVEGKDKAYNDWCDQQHVPDLLTVPGWLAAQRFDLSPETGGKPCAWRYMTAYEIAYEQLSPALSEAQSRAGGPKMPLTNYSAAGTYTAAFRQVA